MSISGRACTIPIGDGGSRRIRWRRSTIRGRHIVIAKYVDPNGLDIWEISPTGNITMIKDDKITKISFVNQKGEETKGYEFSKMIFRIEKTKIRRGTQYIFLKSKEMIKQNKFIIEV